MERFTENDILTFFFEELNTLFSAGSPTATIYTDMTQRVEEEYTPTHGAISFDVPFGDPSADTMCGQGQWAGHMILTLEAFIVSQSRSVTFDLLERLDGYLDQGQFQVTTLAPPDGPSVFFYVIPGPWMKYNVDSELYGIRRPCNIVFYRALR